MFLKSFHVGWDLRLSRTHCSESWLRVTMASCLLSALVAIALLCQAGDSLLSTLVSLPPQTVLCSTLVGLSCLEHGIWSPTCSGELWLRGREGETQRPGKLRPRFIFEGLGRISSIDKLMNI